jgi:hypothetical protein
MPTKLILTEQEEELLRRLAPEMQMWTGAEETPHGYPLSEEDDEVLQGLINKLEERA